MARISSYAVDGTVNNMDKLLGSTQDGVTANFTPDVIADYFTRYAGAEAAKHGQTYEYGGTISGMEIPDNASGKVYVWAAEEGAPTDFPGITSIVASETTNSGINSGPILKLYVGEIIKIAGATQEGSLSYGLFQVTADEEYVQGLRRLTLDYLDGAGGFITDDPYNTVVISSAAPGDINLDGLIQSVNVTTNDNDNSYTLNITPTVGSPFVSTWFDVNHTILSGGDPPAAALGQTGDFYIQTGTDPKIYGPKTALGWGSATNLNGEAVNRVTYTGGENPGDTTTITFYVNDVAIETTVVVQPGQEGEDGMDGISVTNAEINEDGNLIITLSNGETIDAGTIQSLTSVDGVQVLRPDLVASGPVSFAVSGSVINVLVSEATGSQGGLLSSSNFTKVEGIEAGAEVNVQSDWDATTGDAAILNKPTTITDAQATAISANTTGVASNLASINSLNTTVGTNTGNIASNATAISANASNIAENINDISSLETNVATNTTGIAANVTNIATNTSDIADNDAGITSLGTLVATNTAGIATNVAAIALNTAKVGLDFGTTEDTVATWAEGNSTAQIPADRIPTTAFETHVFEGTYAELLAATDNDYQDGEIWILSAPADGDSNAYLFIGTPGSGATTDDDWVPFQSSGANLTTAVGATTVTVVNSAGTDAVLPATTATAAGVLTPVKLAEIDANTLKTGITAAQAGEITVNTAKTGITAGQASAITANTTKVGITTAQAAQIVVNNAKVGITAAQATAIGLNTDKVGITQDQADAITANSAKTGITDNQANAIIANTAKEGITQAQADAIVANTAKTGLTFGTSAGTVAEWAEGDDSSEIPSSKIVDASDTTDGIITAALYTKLNNLPAGAEANVQSDWDQATNTEDDYIKNKPTTISTDQATDITNSKAVTDKLDVSDVPADETVNVNDLSTIVVNNAGEAETALESATINGTGYVIEKQTVVSINQEDQSSVDFATNDATNSIRLTSNDSNVIGVTADVAATNVSGLMSFNDKRKLDGISENADVSVRSNWNVDESNTAGILNKPGLVGDAANQYTYGFVTDAQSTKLAGIQPGATLVEVNADNVTPNVDATTITVMGVGNDTVSYTIPTGTDVEANPGDVPADAVDLTAIKVGSTDYVIPAGNTVRINGTELENPNFIDVGPVNLTASSGDVTIAIDGVTSTQAGLMSSGDKGKLDGIETGADVNVTPDWNAAAGNSAEILNKPDTISTAQATQISSNTLRLSTVGAGEKAITGIQVSHAGESAKTTDLSIEGDGVNFVENTDGSVVITITGGGSSGDPFSALNVDVSTAADPAFRNVTQAVSVTATWVKASNITFTGGTLSASNGEDTFTAQTIPDTADGTFSYNLWTTDFLDTDDGAKPITVTLVLNGTDDTDDDNPVTDTSSSNYIPVEIVPEQADPIFVTSSVAWDFPDLVPRGLYEQYDAGVWDMDLRGDNGTSFNSSIYGSMTITSDSNDWSYNDSTGGLTHIDSDSLDEPSPATITGFNTFTQLTSLDDPIVFTDFVMLDQLTISPIRSLRYGTLNNATKPVFGIITGTLRLNQLGSFVDDANRDIQSQVIDPTTTPGFQLTGVTGDDPIWWYLVHDANEADLTEICENGFCHPISDVFDDPTDVGGQFKVYISSTEKGPGTINVTGLK